MERPFSSKDAKQVQSTHRLILDNLVYATKSKERYIAQIKEAAKALLDKEYMKVLQGIPIEELNRNKNGIHVKTLRNRGYISIADIETDTASSLSFLRGISYSTACFIKRISKSIASKAKEGLKIRLSLDDQSPEATALVQALFKYRSLQEILGKCWQFLEEHQQEVESNIKTLHSGAGIFRWFFSSKAKKERTIEAFNFLSSLIDGRYLSEAESLLAVAKGIEESTGGEAWQKFGANPITFFNDLENVNPGVLGNDDNLYGLPEELASDIQDEDFYPEGLKCALRRYQEWGVRYALHQKRILLGDEMGLGKTVQAIAAMVSLHNTGGQHFLVVCPASVVANWCREITKMSRLRAIQVHGSSRDSANYYWLNGGGVAVTTYESTADFYIPNNFTFKLMVVDEAHYIKNPRAKRSINVKRISAHAERLMFMTGTALENRVDEMINLIQILQPRIASQIQSMAFMSSAPQFRKAIAPVYYRRKREDVLTELPELMESREWCSLNSSEEIAYEQALMSGNYANVRRVSWNIDDISQSSKGARLVELVSEAESEGRKVIVFSFFLDTISKVSRLLGSKCTEPINGSVSPQHRQEIIDNFDRSPAGTVLVAQIQSGGTGLNIQSASVVVLCEPQFKPSIENQAISRAYRMGQTRNVLVYRLLCEGTVDERIISILEKKQAIFEAFADKSEAAQNQEIDSSTFGDIVKDELERIRAKHRNK